MTIFARYTLSKYLVLSGAWYIRTYFKCKQSFWWLYFLQDNFGSLTLHKTLILNMVESMVLKCELSTISTISTIFFFFFFLNMIFFKCLHHRSQNSETAHWNSSHVKITSITCFDTSRIFWLKKKKKKSYQLVLWHQV